MITQDEKAKSNGGLSDEERSRRTIEHSMLSIMLIILAILFALLVFNKMVPPDPETFNAHTEP